MSVKLGNILLNKIYLGATVLNKLYLGVIIVYESLSKIVRDYITRVEADGGVVESELCVDAELSETASLQMIPGGYKATKLYSVLPENGVGDFTVDRNSTATRVNEQGLIEEIGVNVPLIDYSDGGCPVLLTQPQSVNLFPYSQDFSVSNWTKTNVVIDSNIIISPEDSLTGNRLTKSAFNASLNDAIAVIEFLDYTLSCFVRKDVSNSVTLQLLRSTNSCAYNFNLDTSVIIQDGGNNKGLVGTEIQEIGNGWFKCSLTMTVPTTGGISCYIKPSFFADTSGSIFLWGAQLEQLSYPTSYIKTEGSTVTRLQDVVTVTPPVGTTEIIETIDGIEQAPITVIPPTYTVPFGNINQIIMNS